MADNGRADDSRADNGRADNGRADNGRQWQTKADEGRQRETKADKGRQRKVFANHKADAGTLLWVVKKGEAGTTVRGSHVLVEVRLLDEAEELIVREVEAKNIVLGEEYSLEGHAGRITFLKPESHTVEWLQGEIFLAWKKARGVDVTTASYYGKRYLRGRTPVPKNIKFFYDVGESTGA
jgi:hypothetical protein